MPLIVAAPVRPRLSPSIVSAKPPAVLLGAVVDSDVIDGEA